ncbi:beta-microseminoprotein J1-like protein [Lates japonicus]|uniref:Beta-microseminoprotein J1-like protein n=1 Tax=Lates japonicus TaxID=270547 RepID=A0AAD3RFT5_LATJO|nr:beta-microseminoprotein J1-like protein [Lates japonicus]
MNYLTLAVLLCGLLSLSNASCGYKIMEPGATHCQDDVDKTWHAVGATWRNSKCMDCNCRSCSAPANTATDIICSQCCTGYFTPTRFPNDCVKVFDPEACKYVVHKRNDPSVLCPVR